jgi:hypothetical protein
VNEGFNSDDVVAPESVVVIDIMGEHPRADGWKNIENKNMR